MNQIGSYFEINKENLFSQGKSSCGKDTFFDPSRTPLRDITYLFERQEDSQIYEEKVKKVFNCRFLKKLCLTIKLSTIPSSKTNFLPRNSDKSEECLRNFQYLFI